MKTAIRGANNASLEEGVPPFQSAVQSDKSSKSELVMT